MSKRSIAKAGELSARAGNGSSKYSSAPEYDRVLRRSWLVGPSARFASHHLLPRHGARAHRARERVDRRRRRQIDAIAFEACDALLLGAGPGLIPRDVDVVRDLVAVDRVGAAIAGHAAEQGFRLRRRRVGSRRLAAAVPDIEHHHAAVGRVIDVTGGM